MTLWVHTVLCKAFSSHYSSLLICADTTNAFPPRRGLWQWTTSAYFARWVKLSLKSKLVILYRSDRIVSGGFLDYFRTEFIGSEYLSKNPNHIFQSSFLNHSLCICAKHEAHPEPVLCPSLFYLWDIPIPLWCFLILSILGMRCMPGNQARHFLVATHGSSMPGKLNALQSLKVSFSYCTILPSSESLQLLCLGIFVGFVCLFLNHSFCLHYFVADKPHFCSYKHPRCHLKLD